MILKKGDAEMILKNVLENDLKITILSSHEVYKWQGTRRAYYINLSYNNKNYRFTFYDSINAYKNNEKLNHKDTLYAVLMDMQAYDNAPIYNDFCNEFGYDPYNDDYPYGTWYNKEAYRAFEGCRKASEHLHEMFTSAELEALQEHFSDY